jgi:hypothetical protein
MGENNLVNSGPMAVQLPGWNRFCVGLDVALRES